MVGAPGDGFIDETPEPGQAGEAVSDLGESVSLPSRAENLSSLCSGVLPGLRLHQRRATSFLKSRRCGVSTFISAAGILTPVGQVRLSGLAFMRRPVAVRVLPVESTTVSKRRSGYPRQFLVM